MWRSHNHIRSKGPSPLHMARVLANNSYITPNSIERLTPEARPLPERRNSTTCVYYPTFYSYLSVHRLDRKDADTQNPHYHLQETQVFQILG